MEIQQEETATKGHFFIKEDGKILADMVYSKAGTDRIIIEHTQVDDQLRGKGAGKELVEEAVKYARKMGISIIPLCPFARSVFNKREDLRDVL